MSTPKRAVKIRGTDCVEEIHSGSPLVSATHSIEVVGAPPHHPAE